MSAHFINEPLFIVARAESEGAERKLLRAGASRVISPYSIGGHRVAQAVLRPNAMDFIELATRTAHLELQIEEIELKASSRLVGVPLKESPIKSELGHHRRGHQAARRTDALQPRPGDGPGEGGRADRPRPPPAARPARRHGRPEGVRDARPAPASTR